LFTPQRLFGEVVAPPNTFSYEPFLERARVQREQDRDASARLALGGYVVARLVDKLLLQENDAEAQEAFRWQLQAVRRHVRDLPGDAPETAHLAGVVDAVPAQGAPTSSLWMSLTAYAYFLEHEGRLEEALELVVLAARAQGTATPSKDFATYALFAGRLNRLLARWEAASACYSAAEEAAAQSGDSVALLRGRLGRGAVHRGQGNYPAARAAAEEVVRQAAALRLQDAQALAYADLGTICTFQGLPLEALEAHYQAFRLSCDPVQRMRTLSDLAIDLTEIGAYDAARLAFEIVIASNTSYLVRLNALLELMDIESSVGNRVSFERCRDAIEQERSRMSPNMTVDYHYKVGIGLARFGQTARGRDALALALEVAEAHRLNAWYFRTEQAIARISISEEPQSRSQDSSEFSEAPVVHQVVVGLREYAAATAV
jgi:tetratricopeptide (TPR) repeat protein